MAIQVVRRIDDARLILGVAEVRHGTVRPASAALAARAAGLAQRMGSADYAVPEHQRSAVRRLLKLGGFSATGRNRPAHELLINDIKERGGFHHINNVVDVNNVISLEALLPISIFDIDQLAPPVVVRLAVEGEGYVFNQSGQYMDLKRCIVCCHSPEDAGPEGVVIGSPVKDSMATKVFEGAQHILGVIYGTAECCTAEQMAELTHRFAGLLAEETGGRVAQTVLV